MIKRLTKKQYISSRDIEVYKKQVYADYIMHSHEFYEIEFVLSGSGEYIVNDEKYNIEKGMLFFMSPIDFHELKNANVSIINIMFSAKICDERKLFYLTQKNHGCGIKLSDKDFEFVNSLTEEMLKFSAENPLYCSEILGVLLTKLSLMRNIPLEKKLSSIQSTILYIQSNFRSQIHLSDIASNIGISSSYLSSLFSKEMGITIKQYISSLRFDYVEKLLEYSDLSISEICYESGFEDYANFMRQFKKKYNTTPRKYRSNI